MGKKNKIKDVDFYGGNEKVDKLLKRYGVKGANTGRSDGGTRRSAKDVKRELKDAARNDYDTRRSLEAAGLSGNKKAAKTF